jgi:hypothetical protein
MTTETTEASSKAFLVGNVKNPMVRATRSFYCIDDDLWNTFRFNAKQNDKSTSEQLVALITEFNAKYANAPVTVNLTDLKDDRVKWLKTEQKLAKLLEDTICEGNRSAYEVMLSLAIDLGSDEFLEKGVEDVLAKLPTLKPSKDDLFTHSMLETFIEYIEAVLKRREIEAEIRKHRHQNGINLQDKKRKSK